MTVSHTWQIGDGKGETDWTLALAIADVNMRQYIEWFEPSWFRIHFRSAPDRKGYQASLITSVCSAMTDQICGDNDRIIIEAMNRPFGKDPKWGLVSVGWEHFAMGASKHLLAMLQEAQNYQHVLDAYKAQGAHAIHHHASVIWCYQPVEVRL